MKTIFTLSSARSGTLFLRDLFRNNVKNCVCRHETFFDFGNPTFFGPAIYDAFAGRREKIRARLKKKRDYISRLRTEIYLESSHAFLKSTYSAALEFFPDLQLVHLIRNPISVAKSEAYREGWRRRVHAPFHFYTGDDGRRHFCWALTRNEEIFSHFDSARLSLFQLYLIQWIEIENRAMQFLDENNLRDRCFTLHSPYDLNNNARVRQMFDFFGLETISPQIISGGRKNKSIGYKKTISETEEKEFAEVLKRMPARYLEIFQREPYVQFNWSARLQPQKIPSQKVLANAF